jgi:predicted GNAT family acetyltransferase
MGWFITGSVDEFLVEAGPFLHAEPARNTVILSVTKNLVVKAAAGRRSGPQAARSMPRAAASRSRLPRDDEPLYGWWRPRPGEDTGGSAICGAFMHTPGFPAFLTSMSSGAAVELAAMLAATRRRLPGVNAETQAAEAFADAWRDRTGDAATVFRRMRLHRLAELVRPDPGPEGNSRVADERDRSLLTEWFGAFALEVGDDYPQDHAVAVDDRLGYGGLTVWEASGAPVSVAGITRPVDGMVRVGPVYTPLPLRGRGYAGGATVAISQAALDAGAAEVVLYTDLANPTSNALYKRLGYRPVEDRVILSFAPQETIL